MWLIQEQVYRIIDFFYLGGAVMLPLAVASFVMWALIFNRVLFFRRLYHKNMSRVEAAEHIQQNAFPDEKYRGTTALLTSEFLQRRSGVQRIDRYVLDETVMSLVASLDEYLPVIGVLAGMAPLFGLLGTVTGMITTFDVIALFGTGNAKAMAGGISEALVTTQAGLFVAIPGLYMKNFLARRAQVLKYRFSSLGIYLKQYV